jgi:hypothetical protein
LRTGCTSTPRRKATTKSGSERIALLHNDVKALPITRAKKVHAEVFAGSDQHRFGFGLSDGR